MKIVNQINFQPGDSFTDSATYIASTARLNWDPSLYTSVTEILFQVNTLCDDGSVEGDVLLYDVTNDRTITTISFDSVAYGPKFSGNIKTLIPEACVLGVWFRRPAGDANKFARIYSASLSIKQDTSLANRKTAAYFPIFNYQILEYNVNWQELISRDFAIPFDEIDGAFEAVFEGFLWSSTGEAVRLRLYDVTASEVVSDSEVSTISESFVPFATGKLNLIDSHVYRVQYKVDDLGNIATIGSGFVRVVQSGFNKCLAVPSTWNVIDGVLDTDWASAYSRAWFDPTEIEATDSLTYKFNWNIRSLAAGENGIQVRLYDSEADAMIVGTYHSRLGDGDTSFYLQDTPVLPETLTILTLTSICDTSHTLGIGFLIAVMEETLPAGAAYQADPSLRTGFSSFVSQFMKRRKANLVPLETPDGVNFCW